MYHPTIFFDQAFLLNVVVGWFLTAGGAVLIMAAAVWATWAEGDWVRGKPKPAAFRGLCVIGVAAFVGGWVWQAIGYYRIGALTFQ